jgi:hypothetical protein
MLRSMAITLTAFAAIGVSATFGAPAMARGGSGGGFGGHAGFGGGGFSHAGSEHMAGGTMSRLDNLVRSVILVPRVHSYSTVTVLFSVTDSFSEITSLDAASSSSELPFHITTVVTSAFGPMGLALGEHLLLKARSSLTG